MHYLVQDGVEHNAELRLLADQKGEDGADVGVAVDEVGRPIWIFWTIFQFVMATYWVDAPIGTMFNFLDV